MFERFTDRARRGVVLAQEEARVLNTNWIGVEHILMGLLMEGEGVGFKALAELGVTAEVTRTRIREALGERTWQLPSGHVPFTPRAKKSLEYALREALSLGHNYIGTEHILLGLIREGHGDYLNIDDRAESASDVPCEKIRDEVLRILASYTPPAAAVEEKRPTQPHEAIIFCTSMIDGVADPRERAAVAAYLNARYSA